MIPELETERLRLRGWHAEDFEAYAAFAGDTALNAHRGGAVDRIRAWDEFCAILGQWELLGIGNFAVEEKSSGDVAGYAGLWFPQDLDEPELCWSLFEAFHGRGYATEAARAVQLWAYEEKNLPPLMSYIHPGNIPSQRVAERLGATFEKDTELRGSPRWLYRHVLPATHLISPQNMIPKKENEPCH